MVSVARSLPTIGVVCVLVLCAHSVAAQTRAANAASSAKDDTFMIRPERTAYRETSRYDDVMALIRAVDARSSRGHATTFGYTFEGRPLPLVIVGDVADASPEAVKKSGKTRVYIQGNIHAGEVEGKEVLLILLRELARGEHAAWLDSLVLLIAPIYNADGNERVRMSERNLQNGPIGGVGQRPNAQDLDLNRDHMKLESPEARSLTAMLRTYDPQLAIDLHTTNGSFHAYHLTYAPPLHPNTAPAIVDWLRKDWLPSITRAIKAKDGWDFYYYGNVEGEPRSATRGWYTFDHRPRFNNNYLGLRNRLAILSEAYSYLPFDQRIAVTRRFVIEILDYARQHAAEIRKVVEDADRASLVGQTLALRAKTKRAPELVDILLGGVNRVRHPYTGAAMLQRTDERRVERMGEWGTFEATDTERVPAAYLVPAELDRVVELLEAHGARVTPLAADRSMEVEEFRIESSEVTPRAFQGHRERTLTGAWRRAAPAASNVPAGTVVVPMDQPLARLIFTLLEPRSDDGVANWNLLDDVFEKAEKAGGAERLYPIRRTLR